MVWRQCFDVSIVCYYAHYAGEVVVWDTSQTEETLVASSGIGDDCHRDPVSKLTWIPDPESKGKKFQVRDLFLFLWWTLI